MRIIFDDTKRICTYESGEIKIHFSSITNDDMIGWLMGNERFKLDPSKLIESIVDGENKLTIDYSKISSEEAKQLYIDDMRFACTKITGLEGIEIEKGGESVSVSELSIDERLDLLRAVDEEKEDFSGWVKTYIRGSKKKYAGLHIDNGEVGE